MIVNRILRNRDTVSLCGTSGYALDLTYAAWADFLKKRGALTLPFDVRFVFKPKGKTNVVITTAREIA